MLKIAFSLFAAALICSCSSDNETSYPIPHPFGNTAQATAAVNFTDFYTIEIPEKFKKVNLPNINNAINVYPDLPNKPLFGKCTMQILSDAYTVVPTSTRRQILLHEAIDKSRDFITQTTIDKKDLAISKINEVQINNLSGYQYEITSHNKQKFFHSMHYMLINPDDIGILYASIVSFDENTAQKCFAESSQAVKSIIYAPKEEIY